jgi:hypothetical protein
MVINDHRSLLSQEARAVKYNLCGLADRNPYFTLLLSLTAQAQQRLHAKYLLDFRFAVRK